MYIYIFFFYVKFSFENQDSKFRKFEISKVRYCQYIDYHCYRLGYQRREKKCIQFCKKKKKKNY
jgi:hypothetical protein